MDRRLYNAYDKITMPDGCSQKIETLLMEGTKTKTKRRNQVLLRPKSRWQTWSSAAALVCLAVVISLGGVMLYLGLGQQRNSQNIPRFSQTTETREKTGDFPLSETGERFLLKMCQAMPDWESYYVLDDDFWEEFLFYSFTNPEKVENGKAETIIGELPFEEDRVLLSREQAEKYATLTMGCDLPLPREEYSRIAYTDGIYRIPRTEAGSRLYHFRGLDEESQEECLARFDVYGGQPGKKLGVVTMKLRTADNENGFLIVNKVTDWEIPEEPLRLVREKDEGCEFPSGGEPFRVVDREGEHFTARQIFMSSQSQFKTVTEMLSSELCYGYEERDGELVEGIYRLTDGGWEPAQCKTLTKVHREDGREFATELSYVEIDGKPYMPYYVTTEMGLIERPQHSTSYRVVYTWDPNVTDRVAVVDGPYRLDLDKGELAGLWGNVPQEDRAEEISNNFSMITFFRDGSFLIPCVESTDPYVCSFLYVDPEKGQVYHLEDLCGSELDDFTPVGEEIFCWKDGEYWRIPRDTMRPEYLGKLQENVVFASGVWGGDWATFSVEQLSDGSYRIFDYLENRMLTLDAESAEQMENFTLSDVSPDGRKVLVHDRSDMPIILDCDRKQLLTIDTGLGVTREENTEWTESSDLWIRGTYLWGYWIYTFQ